jgi:hypothetical protein
VGHFFNALNSVCTPLSNQIPFSTENTEKSEKMEATKKLIDSLEGNSDTSLSKLRIAALAELEALRAKVKYSN